MIELIGCHVQIVTTNLHPIVLTEAFTRFRAKRVSLVVFPENKIALRCYGRAGLIQVGEQIKFFETTGEHHRMIAMSIDRSRFCRTYQQRRVTGHAGT